MPGCRRGALRLRRPPLLLRRHATRLHVRPAPPSVSIPTPRCVPPTSPRLRSVTLQRRRRLHPPPPAGNDEKSADPLPRLERLSPASLRAQATPSAPQRMDDAAALPLLELSSCVRRPNRAPLIVATMTPLSRAAVPPSLTVSDLSTYISTQQLDQGPVAASSGGSMNTNEGSTSSKCHRHRHKQTYNQPPVALSMEHMQQFRAEAAAQYQLEFFKYNDHTSQGYGIEVTHQVAIMSGHSLTGSTSTDR